MEQSNNDVPQGSSPAQEMQLPSAPVVTQQPATPTGSKTPPENLYAALEEERALRKEDQRKYRELEDKFNQLHTTDPSETEFVSDEGRILKGQLDNLSAKLSQIEEEKSLDKLFVQYPMLKENADKFKEFRQAEHPRAKIESVAKLFLAENGLLEKPRVGLESPTGGGRAPIDEGMTPEDVANLRKTNFKKYQEMLSKGQIKMKQS